MEIAQDVTQLVGDTPLVRINKFSKETGTEILGKCEFMNPSSSVKDRLALALIESGLKDGNINHDTTIIEPTSGNTGIGLGMVCASKGLQLILTMPESMSVERRQLLKAFGAKLELTPAKLGMNGAITRASQLIQEVENSYMPQQFQNQANAQKHRETTALEILKDTDGKVDIFVAAVGTGGTLTGVSEVLRQHNQNIEIIAVEPASSPVISGGSAAPHKIQGIGAGFIPKVLNTAIFDEIIKVEDEDAYETSRQLAKNEGLLVGISAGANVWAATQVASRAENKGKTIVTILCDTGERYLSASLYNNLEL